MLSFYLIDGLVLMQTGRHELGLLDRGGLGSRVRPDGARSRPLRRAGESGG